MVKPIDAEKYMELLKEQYLHYKAMKHGESARAWQGAIQLLYDMPTLTPQDEWVSVKDRLPYAEYGESNSVLCVTKIGTQIVLYFDGSCWCYPTGETFCHGVTHWMPLPEPPEEG